MTQRIVTGRCAMIDCIAPAFQTVTDGDSTYVFCEPRWLWFEEYLESLRVERDALVAQGIDLQFANRIVQQRVERQEL